MAGLSTRSEPVAMLGASDRFAINRPDGPRGWRVREGGVDIFLQVAPPAGRGVRWHGFRIGAGEALYRLPGGARAIDWIAVPLPDTELAELGEADCRAPDPVDEQRWLSAIARILCLDPAPTRAVERRPGEQAVANGDILAGEGALRWLRVEQGRMAPVGVADLAVDAQNAPWPLAGDVWYRAEADSRVELLPGRPDGTDFATRTAWAVDAAERIHLERDSRLAAAHALRVAARRASDGKRDSDSGAALHSILHRAAAAPRSPAGTLQPADPAVEAVAFLARCGNVGFEPPPAPPPGDLPTLVRVDLILRGSGLLWRRVTLEGEWWTGDVAAFLVVRLEDAAPLVVHRKGRRYRVTDPASGSSVAFAPEMIDTLEPTGVVVSRPLPYVSPLGLGLLRFGLERRGGDVGLLLGIGLCLGLLALLTPLLTSHIVGEIIPNAARGQLVQYTLLLVGVTVSSGVFGLAQALTTVRLSALLDSELQGAIWDRLMRLPVGFFRDFAAGDLANRATGVNSINSTLTYVTVMGVLTGIFASLNFLLMLWYSWQLSLIALGGTLATLAVTVALTSRQLVWQRRKADTQGRIAGLSLQIIEGIDKLRVAHAEVRAHSVWAEAYREQNLFELHGQRFVNRLTVFNTVVPSLSTMLIFLAIGFIPVPVALGTFVAFNAAFSQFFGGMIGLSAAYSSIAGVLPLYRRAKPILLAAPEVDLSRQHVDRLSGHVGVHGVTFRYQEDAPPCLDQVSFAVEPGEFVAIVGASGSGKSTLVRLLVGFETPESGTISYNHRDLATLDVRSVRQQMGVVLQHSRLFPGSLYQNIVGNRPRLTLDDAWRAAALVALDDDIRAMPMGMETLVTEGATTLSAGQRQRLMIARAIVGEPRILILDEATSALDNHSQSIVTQNLARLKVARIVVAQRLSTIMGADRIYCLADGRIAQQGSYEELMAVDGPFRDLIRRQIA